MTAARRLRMTIASTFEDVALAACAVNALGRLGGLVPERADEVELAVVEALNNVVEHAYGLRPDQSIEVTVELDPEGLAVEILDQGRAAEPGYLEKPRLESLDFDETDIAGLAESGRGSALLHLLLDEVRYRTEAGGNRLRLVKRIEPVES
jgi:serine/threonine-protein kinase RsbW